MFWKRWIISVPEGGDARREIYYKINLETFGKDLLLFFFFFVILMLERIYKFNKITIKYSIIQKLKGIKKLPVKN